MLEGLASAAPFFRVTQDTALIWSPRPPRALFVRPGAFGDVLMTTPFLRRLRAEAPELAVDLFSLVGDVWSGAGGDRWYPIQEHSLRKVQAAHGTTYWFTYEHHPELHPLDGYALATGLEPLGRTLDWTVDEGARAAVAPILSGLPRPWIGFSPTSEHALRTLPVAQVQAVVDGIRRELGGTVLLTGRQPLQVEGCVQLGGALPSMRELGAVMEASDAWIAVDAGPFHLAQALGVPLVGLFGCTLPELRVTRPESVHIVRLESLACLGCYHAIPAGAETLEACGRGDLACLQALEAGQVVQALGEVLAGRPDARLAGRMAQYEQQRDEMQARWTEDACSQAREDYRIRVASLEQEHPLLKRLERRVRRWRKRGRSAQVPG